MKRAELVNYRKGEGSILIPNEIFDDLQGAIEQTTHVAFAYSYYYLITYLYRYSKYVETKFTQPMLKEFLGFSPKNKQLDYIIKKGGILDSIGYTRSTTDYPVAYTLDSQKHPEFTLMSEWKKKYPEMAITLPEERNYKIKYPVKAFFRNEIAERNEYYNGTFYEARNTHSIHVKTFLDAMEDDTEYQLKCIGFYLYGYINARIGQYGGEWTAISIDQLVKGTRLSNGTVNAYLKRLQKRGFLCITRQDFFDNPTKHANVYELGRK